MRRFLLLSIILLSFSKPLHAQIDVGLQIKRHFLMIHEPIVANVTIKNMAGRDITLSDTPSQCWFSFQIARGGGQLVPPLDPNYRLNPLTVPAGQLLKRSVDLNALYPMREMGEYKVQAVVYFAATDKYYVSAPIILELSEGKTIWQRTVGVPEGQKGAGETRRFSLLEFRQADYNMIYARVEDVDSGTVYCTVGLGRFINGIEPNVEVDLKNNLHVLQVVGPKSYFYSSLDINGNFLAHENYYSNTNGRPVLKRDAAGNISVFGASLQPNVNDTSERMKNANKLSDRPVQIPKE